MEISGGTCVWTSFYRFLLLLWSNFLQQWSLWVVQEQSNVRYMSPRYASSLFFQNFCKETNTHIVQNIMIIVLCRDISMISWRVLSIHKTLMKKKKHIEKFLVLSAEIFSFYLYFFCLQMYSSTPQNKDFYADVISSITSKIL